ncbi:tail assembly protein [Cyanophage S-RIM44]|uniref:Tail assembly protein n=2 Tax=Vellamovirus TaxID=2733139 RepID=A0A127KN23_9CAUD|nr:tail sheath stabilizer [Prochlorococcus phage Syn1]AMO43351.1 tail assembly protein [Cyanophage S-RIM44]ADO99209.1 proximal tail sheath stabilization [Prochlorococcus phage Syn1]AOO11823.1 tail assembly protein [Cyanophage S-RIM44]AOO12524.1 tail assembly protein [Cyanophage S-RIM44]AOO12990.1 tail assembly protein [Cyanophage S-RIM44]
MFGSHFYNEIIRKNIVGFGTLFNNISLKKIDPSDNSVLEEEKVPLAYGPKAKFLTRLEQNPDVGRKIAITLPRIYFEMTGIQYDSSRKTSPIQKYRKVQIEDGNEVAEQYVPVPYTLEFQLGIIAKSQDDGLQILEQILPYFQPSFNITLNMIPDMDEKRDVAITLNNVQYDDAWDDGFLERRYITWELSFTAKSYIYGPYDQASVINKAIVYEGINSTVPQRTTKVTYTPKALEDKNNDGVVNALDDELLTAGDDFGFNEGIELL